MAITIAFFALKPTLIAQQLPTLGVSAYAGQNISSVGIAGRPDVTFKSVQDIIAVNEGKPLTQHDVDASIAALKQHGGIDNVRLDLQPAADGVQVLFILEPAVYVGMYDFPGALREFTYTSLLQAANYNSQTPYSETDIQNAEDSLVLYFRQHGYFQAEVHPEIVPQHDPRLVNIVFRTDLGLLARIGKINLDGADPQMTSYLQTKLRSTVARLRVSSLKPGMRYSYSRLQTATKYLQSQLARQNYIAGQIKLISAEYDATTNRADITFKVTTGQLVKVVTTGTHVGRRTVENLVPIYQVNAVNDELIDEGQNNIRSYFQAKGYFDTKVDVKVDNNPAGTTITYDINRDGRFKVSQVGFKGNHRFNNKELQNYITVQKAHVLGHGKYSEALLRASVKNLTDTYRAAGYSQVSVVPNVVRSDGNVNITFEVTEGPRNVVHALSIVGNDTLPETEFAPHGLNLGPGKPYSQDLVLKDRSLIVARYLTLGYLNASFHATSKPVPGAPHQLDVVYQISEGPRVVTATVITDGRQHTRQSMIDKELRIATGQPLSENNMLSSESHLYNLGIFDWAEVDPRRPITDQTHEDVIVKVHEAKRNSVTYGFGFQILRRGGAIPSGTVAVPGLPPVGLPGNFVTSEKTFWGPEGTFEYMRRNILGKADTFTFSSYAGVLDQRGSLNFTQPSLFGSSWKGSAILSGEHNSVNPIFSDLIGTLGYQLQRPLNPKKTTNLFLRYNLQFTKLSNLLIPELVPPNQLRVRLSTLTASWVHDTRDNVLDAHRGWYQNYEIDLNPYWLGSNFSFAQFVSQTAHYQEIGKGIVWANSLRIGLEQPFAGSEVPVSSAFFAGGGSTLRGFPLDGAGPQREIQVCGIPGDLATCSKITVPDGGNELLIINSELRFPLSMIKKGLGIVTFYDGGNVFPTIGFHDFTSLYSNNVGLGLRYATPVGPIRIDIGRNLNPVPGISSTQYFITLGQAF
jgi:outer membrane protein insertion porin family